MQTSWLTRFVGEGKPSAWQYITGFIAIVFAVQRFATALFYSQFSVASEEVGIGYVEGTVLYLFVLVVLNVVVLLPATLWLLHTWVQVSSFARALWADTKEKPWKTLAYVAHRGAFFVVVGTAVMFKDKVRIAALVAAAVLGFLADTVENPFSWRWGNASVAPEDVRQRALRIVISIAVLLTASFLAAQFFWAWRDARAAQEGLEVSGFPAAVWRAQRVMISSLQPSPPAVIADAQGHCLMYLGQANGVTVLFDVDDQRILRLPTSGVMLRTEMSPDRGSPCATRRPGM